VTGLRGGIRKAFERIRRFSTEQLRRALNLLAYLAIAVVAMFALWPTFMGDDIPVASLNASRVGACAGVLFALAMILFPFHRFLRAGETKAAAQDVRTEQLAMSLWVFVFSFGTAVALYGSRIPDSKSAVDAVSKLTPRLFVSWFLSVLTMVATRVLSQLDKIQDRQKELEQSITEAQKVATNLAEGARSAETTAGQTIRIAADAVRVVDKYAELQRAELKLEHRGLRLLAKPTHSFVMAANERLELMTEIAKSLEATVGDGIDQGSSLRAEILLPALLPYIGKDPWRPGRADKIEIVQEGSYLLYARLIEAILWRVVRCIVGTSSGSLVCQHSDAHIEVFTTLEVIPSHFYNVVGSSDESTASNGGVRLDSSETVRSWERYRAVQTAAIKLGRVNDRFRLTRCFVTRDDGKALTADLAASTVPRNFFRSYSEIVKLLIAAAGVHDSVNATLDDLEAGNNALSHALDAHCNTLHRKEWKLPPTPWNLVPPPGRLDALSYPIHMETFRSRNAYELIAKLHGEDWCPLGAHFVENHITSPEHGLWLDDPRGTLSLPKDVFAVGWSKAVLKQTLPCDLQIAFIVNLDVDERGTQTATRILTPKDGDDFLSMATVICRLSQKQSHGSTPAPQNLLTPHVTALIDRRRHDLPTPNASTPGSS
jgi:hypothetical protein